MMKKILKIFVIFLLSGVAFSEETNYSDLPKQALHIIVSNLKSKDSDIRAYAVEALGKTKNLKLVPIIKKYLSDESKYVQMASVKALWNLADNGGIKKLYEIINDIPAQGTIVNSPLVELKIISQNKIRERAIEILVDLLGRKAKETLFELKNDNYGTIRDVAARELAKLGFKDELENFFDALNSKDEEIRYQSAQVLSKICPDDIKKIIEALSSEKSVRVKMFLLDTIKCSMYKKDAIEQLLELSDDKNLTIRYKAIDAMGEIESSKVDEKLKKIYMDTPDFNLKFLALKYLLKKGKININYQEIDEIFNYGDEDIKKGIIEISPFMEKEKALKYLSELMKDKNAYLQIDAAVAVINLTSKQDKL